MQAQRYGLIAALLCLTGCGFIVGKYNYQPIRSEPIPYNDLVASAGYRHCFDVDGINIHAEPGIGCPDRSEVQKAIEFFIWEQKLADGVFVGHMVIFAGSQIGCTPDCKKTYPQRLDKKRRKNKTRREKCLAEQAEGLIQGFDGCRLGFLAVVNLEGRAGMRGSWEEHLYHEICHFLSGLWEISDPAHEVMQCYSIPPPAPVPYVRGF